MQVWVCLIVATFAGWSQSEEGISCLTAQQSCAYRLGCGSALQNYIAGCSGLQYTVGKCPESCLHSLVALTATEEGKELMTCECSDDFCKETKDRVEVCRPDVLQAILNETVSCDTARWICEGDSVCKVALKYYNRYCRAMFKGKSCTNRCKNSISILRKQKAAAKLDSCTCNGKEDYDCLKIRANMAQMCFPEKAVRVEDDEVDNDLARLTRDSNGVPASPGSRLGFLLLLPCLTAFSW